jgi:hypothetical protein
MARWKENYVEVNVYSKKAANLTGQVGTDFIKNLQVKPICILEEISKVSTDKGNFI